MIGPPPAQFEGGGPDEERIEDGAHGGPRVGAGLAVAHDDLADAENGRPHV